MFELVAAISGMLANVFRSCELQQANCAAVEFDEELKVTKAELEEARDLLRQVHDAARNSSNYSAALANTVETVLARPDADKARADEVIRRIDELMQKGENVLAVGLMRQETGAVWDHIHDAMRRWKRMTPIQKSAVVVRFLRQKANVTP